MTNAEIKASIPATDGAWDSQQLGADENYVVKASGDQEAVIDSALDLQPVSIRLQKDMVEKLKTIAGHNGISYQPLIRQVLTRFVEAELKLMLRSTYIELEEAKKQLAAVKKMIADKNTTGDTPSKERPKKAA